MNLHNVVIKQNREHVVEVIIDGLAVKGLTEVNYANSIGYGSKVTIEFIPDTLNIEKGEN